MANNLRFGIDVDIVKLQTKFAITKAEISGLTGEMAKLARTFNAGALDSAGQARMQQVAEAMLLAKQRAAELAEQLNKSGASFAHFGAQASQGIGGIGGALEAMQSKVSIALKFTGIGIAIAGLERLAQAFSAVGARAAEIRSMADVLGVTVEQLQSMSAAADAAGVSTETLSRFAERLAGLFQQARDGSGEAVEKLKLLGITNQQIASTTFGVNDALGALHAKLTDASTATATQNEILAEFGPRGALAIEVLKRYSGSAGEVAAEMQRLNGLNAEQAASAADTYAAYREWGTWLENTFTKALDATAQGLARTAEVMLSTPAKMPALQASVQVPSIAPQVQRDAAVAQAALQTVDVTAHKVTQDELNSLRELVEAQAQGSAARLADMRRYAAAAKEFYPTDRADKLLAIEAQLATETRAYGEAQMRASQEASQKQIEAANINKRLIDEQLEDSQRYLTQQREMAQVDAQSTIAIAQMNLHAQLDALDAEFSAHKVTAAQKLAVATELTQQLANLDKQQLQSELATLDPQTAAYERVANQIKEIDAKLYLDLAALRKQFVTDNAKDVQSQVSQWQKSVNEIQNAEGQLTSDLLSRRKSLSQSLIQIGAQLVTQEIQNDLKAFTEKELLEDQKKALEQGGYLYHLIFQNQATTTTGTNLTEQTVLEQQAQTAQTTALIAGIQARTVAQAQGDAAGLVASRAASFAQIMNDASTAAAGGAASVAAIPLVGWSMAPAVAASLYAETAAYAGALEAGAWEMPRAALAMLHPGESVVPRDFASGMRASGMLQSGTGRGTATTGQSAGGGDTHFHIGISAFDGDSVARWASNPDNRRQLTKAVTQHMRGLGYRGL
jgi:hypothetical protein